MFTKEILDDLENIFRDVCLKFESELVEFDGEKDHVHLLVNYPPKVSISSLVNSLKGLVLYSLLVILLVLVMVLLLRLLNNTLNSKIHLINLANCFAGRGYKTSEEKANHLYFIHDYLKKLLFLNITVTIAI